MAKIVLVKWNDAADSEETWIDAEDALRFGEVDCTVRSVGFLISKTARYITLGGDWDVIDANYGRVTKIPASMVLSITELPDPEETEPGVVK